MKVEYLSFGLLNKISNMKMSLKSQGNSEIFFYNLFDLLLTFYLN